MRRVPLCAGKELPWIGLGCASVGVAILRAGVVERHRREFLVAVWRAGRRHARWKPLEASRAKGAAIVLEGDGGAGGGGGGGQGRGEWLWCCGAVVLWC